MTDSPSFRGLPRGLTALQKHAAFFDANGDGTVTAEETKARIEALGIPSVGSAILTPIIHTFLGRLTGGEKDSTISVAAIAAGKHPFDTGVYDAKGNVDREAFDALFAPEGAAPGARTYAVTRREIRRVIKRRGDRDGRFGRAGAVLGYLFSAIEVWLLLRIGSDAEKKDGLFYGRAITRRRLLRFYEGRLFFALARRQRILARGVRLPSAGPQRFDAGGNPLPRQR